MPRFLKITSSMDTIVNQQWLKDSGLEQVEHPDMQGQDILHFHNWDNHIYITWACFPEDDGMHYYGWHAVYTPIDEPIEFRHGNFHIVSRTPMETPEDKVPHRFARKQLENEINEALAEFCKDWPVEKQAKEF